MRSGTERLTPDFVVALIRRLGERFAMCAGDVMEVTPPLARTSAGPDVTLATAGRYADETLRAMRRA